MECATPASCSTCRTSACSRSLVDDQSTSVPDELIRGIYVQQSVDRTDQENRRLFRLRAARLLSTLITLARGRGAERGSAHERDRVRRLGPLYDRFRRAYSEGPPPYPSPRNREGRCRKSFRP